MASHKSIMETSRQMLEQGGRANQQLERTRDDMETAEREVEEARENLASSSRTDENGNPSGNVAQAQAQLRVAEGKLAARRRAYDAARKDVEQINEQKEIQIQAIEDYEQTEKTYLDKLVELDCKYFPQDAAELKAGIQARLKEAEEARIELLRSMGLDASAEDFDISGGVGTTLEGGSSETGSTAVESTEVTVSDDRTALAVEDTEASFYAFAQKYGGERLTKEQRNAMKAVNREIDFQMEVKEMAESLPDGPADYSDTAEEGEVTPEELAYLEENDPGYVSGLVYDYDDPETAGVYNETGYHDRDSVRWSDGGDPIGYFSAPTGMSFGRYGGENGTYMFAADAGVQYTDLELETVEGKKQRFSYTVVKPFPMRASYVKRQDFNKGAPEKKGKRTVQYETPVSVRQLIRHGFLRRS